MLQTYGRDGSWHVMVGWKRSEGDGVHSVCEGGDGWG